MEPLSETLTGVTQPQAVPAKKTVTRNVETLRADMEYHVRQLTRLRLEDLEETALYRFHQRELALTWFVLDQELSRDDQWIDILKAG